MKKCKDCDKQIEDRGDRCWQCEFAWYHSLHICNICAHLWSPSDFMGGSKPCEHEEQSWGKIRERINNR